MGLNEEIEKVEAREVDEVADKGNSQEASTEGKAKKKRGPAKKDFLFNEKDYKTTRKQEKVVKRQAVRRGQVITVDHPTGVMEEIEVLHPDFIRKSGNLRKAECRYRAAAFFGVSVDHLLEAYAKLNGKKIDGIYVTDLIDRFGFSNGRQMSRAQIMSSYGRNNVNVVNVAQDNLKEILNASDVRKSYSNYIKDIKEEFSKDIRDKAIYGE